MVGTTPRGGSMARRGRPGLSARQEKELWSRWRRGQSLSEIGRALGKHAGSIYGVLAASGGITPSPRRRSDHVVSLREREESELVGEAPAQPLVLLSLVHGRHRIRLSIGVHQNG